MPWLGLEAYRSYAYSSLAFKCPAYSHSWIFDNPPVVHILEGIAGHLLLMGTTSSILIPVQRVKKPNRCVTVHFCAQQSHSNTNQHQITGSIPTEHRESVHLQYALKD